MMRARGAARGVRWAVGGTCALLGLGCGGKAVVDGFGSGGGGGATTTATTWTTTTTTTWTTTWTTTTTTPTNCSTHEQCGGGVCVFASGTCAARCSGWEPCPQGQVCNTCATSSCPVCADCVGACQPAYPGQCDDHDDCLGAELCIYWQQMCAPPCDDSGGCADPSLWCDGCATSSCPACEDCLSACVGWDYDR